MRPGVNTKEIGKIVESTIKSKSSKYRPIKELSGHILDEYSLHGQKQFQMFLSHLALRSKREKFMPLKHLPVLVLVLFMIYPMVISIVYCQYEPQLDQKVLEK
jgi:methionine aminopeptidase